MNALAIDLHPITGATVPEELVDGFAPLFPQVINPTEKRFTGFIGLCKNFIAPGFLRYHFPARHHFYGELDSPGRKGAFGQIDVAEINPSLVFRPAIRSHNQMTTWSSHGISILAKFKYLLNHFFRSFQQSFFIFSSQISHLINFQRKAGRLSRISTPNMQSAFFHFTTKRAVLTRRTTDLMQFFQKNA